LGNLKVGGLTDEVGEAEAVHLVSLLLFDQALDLVNNLGADHFRVLLKGERVKYLSRGASVEFVVRVDAWLPSENVTDKIRPSVEDLGLVSFAELLEDQQLLGISFIGPLCLLYQNCAGIEAEVRLH